LARRERDEIEKEKEEIMFDWCFRKNREGIGK
jgi:hypothetical protein